MNKFWWFAFLLVWAATPAHAQSQGEVCKLGDATKLFVSKDGQKFSTKLKKGTKLVLKDKHGDRWMVQTTQGKLGFVKGSWLKKTCAFSAAPAQAKPSTSTSTTPIDAGSIAETAAAMEITRLAAENPDAVGSDVVTSQTQVLDKARDARAANRQKECTEAGAKEAYRVAVYDLELVNIPEGMGKIITASLLSEVRKLEGASVIGMDEIREMINFEAQRQAMGCDADEACMAEIAGALGVDEIITGRLTEESDGRSFLIRRINQRRAEVVSTVNKRLAIGNGEEFLLAVGPAVEELYPNRPNRPGTKRGVAKKVLLRLNPPPITPLVTLSTIGVSVAALAVGGTFAVMGQSEIANYNSGAGQEEGRYEGDASTVFLDSYNRANNYVMSGNVALIAGGATALGAIVMSFFTDWAKLSQEIEDE